jgi:acylphosphatase
LSSSPPPSINPRSDYNNDSNKIRAHVLVSGKVQGVYFRQNTQIVANRYRVSGWVRNLKDGRVELVLEGNETDVSEVIKWCHVGPPNSIVEKVDVRYERYVGEFLEFKINY